MPTSAPNPPRWTWLAWRVHVVLLGVLLGGIVFIDLIEAPVKFGTPHPGLEREEFRDLAIAIGSRVFAVCERVQLALVVAAFLLAWPRRTTWTTLAAALLAASVGLSIWLTPEILDHRGEADQVAILHRAYEVNDVFKFVVALAWFWTAISRPAPRPAKGEPADRGAL